MTRTVSASNVLEMLADDEEIAFLDMREIMAFGTGHPLLAAHAPLSRLELIIGDLVPRRGARIVLTDGGEGLAVLGAARLAPLGYCDVAVLDGGAPAWHAAGGTLFPEIEVPTKGFGAFAEHHGRPSYISPLDFDRARKSGEDWIVLDSRPRREYQNGCIPGGIDAPGADLLRCFDDLVPDRATKVLINCMSFTRGTLGGLSLMAAGVPNEVHVLRHGTRGWLLDGLELEINAARFPAPPSAAAIASAQIRAARIADRAGLARIDAATLAEWQGEADRTTYLFDVRSKEEFAAGHLPGSRNAPEGSIIMSPDRFFATLNARIVLIDDDGVRATVTALWLAQMGWGEVAVLGPGAVLETGIASPPPPVEAKTVSALALDRLRAEQPVRVIDVGSSDAYVAGHVPGALWCSRVALGAVLRDRAHQGPTVLTSADGRLAALAASDLDLAVLNGGNAAWRGAGLAVATGAEHLAGPRDDHWLASSERPGDTRRNVLDYLDWEVGLLADIENSGQMPFRNLIW